MEYILDDFFSAEINDIIQKVLLSLQNGPIPCSDPKLHKLFNEISPLLKEKIELYEDFIAILLTSPEIFRRKNNLCLRTSVNLRKINEKIRHPITSRFGSDFEGGLCESPATVTKTEEDGLYHVISPSGSDQEILREQEGSSQSESHSILWDNCHIARSPTNRHCSRISEIFVDTNISHAVPYNVPFNSPESNPSFSPNFCSMIPGRLSFVYTTEEEKLLPSFAGNRESNQSETDAGVCHDHYGTVAERIDCFTKNEVNRPTSDMCTPYLLNGIHFAHDSLATFPGRRFGPRCSESGTVTEVARNEQNFYINSSGFKERLIRHPNQHGSENAECVTDDIKNCKSLASTGHSEPTINECEIETDRHYTFSGGLMKLPDMTDDTISNKLGSLEIMGCNNNNYKPASVPVTSANATSCSLTGVHAVKVESNNTNNSSIINVCKDDIIHYKCDEMDIVVEDSVLTNRPTDMSLVEDDDDCYKLSKMDSVTRNSCHTSKPADMNMIPVDESQNIANEDIIKVDDEVKYNSSAHVVHVPEDTNDSISLNVDVIDDGASKHADIGSGKNITDSSPDVADNLIDVHSHHSDMELADSVCADDVSDENLSYSEILKEIICLDWQDENRKALNKLVADYYSSESGDLCHTCDSSINTTEEIDGNNCHLLSVAVVPPPATNPRENIDKREEQSPVLHFNVDNILKASQDYSDLVLKNPLPLTFNLGAGSSDISSRSKPLKVKLCKQRHISQSYGLKLYNNKYDFNEESNSHSVLAHTSKNRSNNEMRVSDVTSPTQDECNVVNVATPENDHVSPNKNQLVEQLAMLLDECHSILIEIQQRFGSLYHLLEAESEMSLLDDNTSAAIHSIWQDLSKHMTLMTNFLVILKGEMHSPHDLKPESRRETESLPSPYDLQPESRREMGSLQSPDDLQPESRRETDSLQSPDDAKPKSKRETDSLQSPDDAKPESKGETDSLQSPDDAKPESKGETDSLQSPEAAKPESKGETDSLQSPEAAKPESKGETDSLQSPEAAKPESKGETDSLQSPEAAKPESKGETDSLQSPEAAKPESKGETDSLQSPDNLKPNSKGETESRNSGNPNTSNEGVSRRGDFIHLCKAGKPTDIQPATPVTGESELESKRNFDEALSQSSASHLSGDFADVEAHSLSVNDDTKVPVQKQVEDMSIELNTLRQKLGNMEVTLADRESECSDLTKEINSLKVKISEMTQCNAKLHTEVTYQLFVHEKLRAKCNDLDKEFLKMKNICEGHEALVDNWFDSKKQNSCDDINAELKKLQWLYVNVTENFQALKTEYQENRVLMNTLRDQVFQIISDVLPYHPYLTHEIFEQKFFNYWSIGNLAPFYCRCPNKACTCLDSKSSSFSKHLRIKREQLFQRVNVGRDFVVTGRNNHEGRNSHHYPVFTEKSSAIEVRCSDSAAKFRGDEASFLGHSKGTGYKLQQNLSLTISSEDPCTPDGKISDKSANFSVQKISFDRNSSHISNMVDEHAENDRDSDVQQTVEKNLGSYSQCGFYDISAPEINESKLQEIEGSVVVPHVQETDSISTEPNECADLKEISLRTRTQSLGSNLHSQLSALTPCEAQNNSKDVDKLDSNVHSVPLGTGSTDFEETTNLKVNCKSFRSVAFLVCLIVRFRKAAKKLRMEKIRYNNGLSSVKQIENTAEGDFMDQSSQSVMKGWWSLKPCLSVHGDSVTDGHSAQVAIDAEQHSDVEITTGSQNIVSTTESPMPTKTDESKLKTYCWTADDLFTPVDIVSTKEDALHCGIDTNTNTVLDRQEKYWQKVPQRRRLPRRSKSESDFASKPCEQRKRSCSSSRTDKAADCEAVLMAIPFHVTRKGLKKSLREYGSFKMLEFYPEVGGFLHRRAYILFEKAEDCRKALLDKEILVQNVRVPILDITSFETRQVILKNTPQAARCKEHLPSDQSKRTTETETFGFIEPQGKPPRSKATYGEGKQSVCAVVPENNSGCSKMKAEETPRCKSDVKNIRVDFRKRSKTDFPHQNLASPQLMASSAALAKHPSLANVVFHEQGRPEKSISSHGRGTRKGTPWPARGRNQQASVDGPGGGGETALQDVCCSLFADDSDVAELKQQIRPATPWPTKGKLFYQYKPDRGQLDDVCCNIFSDDQEDVPLVAPEQSVPQVKSKTLQILLQFLTEIFPAVPLKELMQSVVDVRKSNDNSLSGIPYPDLAAQILTDRLHKAGTDEAYCCVLCNNLYGAAETIVLVCFHTFHKICVDGWSRVQPGCPVCGSCLQSLPVD